MRKVKIYGAAEGIALESAVREVCSRMAQSMADELDEAGAEKLEPLFPEWREGESYAAGVVVRGKSGLYKLKENGKGGKRPDASSDWQRWKGGKR